MTRTWERKRLGDLCQLLSGQHIEAKDYNTDGRGVGYLTGPSDFGELYPVVSKWTEHPKVKAESGDILITVKGSGVGKVNLLNQNQIAISRQLMALRVKNADPQFVYAFISSKFDHFQSLATGAAIPGVSREQVLGLELTLPPLPEQKRIVAILDEAFEGIATAQANAERSLKNTRALFEYQLDAVFQRNSDSWKIRRLGDIVTRLTNGFVGPTRNIYRESGIPYLLARHVKNNNLLFDGKTFISGEFNLKNKKSMLKEGDVLLVQSGHIGHSAVVTKEHEGHNCHAMIVITPVDGTFLGSFLSLFFNSSGMKQKFQEIRSGSTVPHLTCGEIKELEIPLPDIATQQRIVDHSREFREESLRLEVIYQRKISALDELKKSLLHCAFAGEL